MTLGSVPGKYGRNSTGVRPPVGVGVLWLLLFTHGYVCRHVCDRYVDGGMCLCGNVHGH